MKRVRSEVICKKCGVTWMKRDDTLKAWHGCCRSCATKEVSNRPEILAMRREVGIAVMRRVGRLPPTPLENRRYGAANNKWKGGITPVHVRVRTSPEGAAWRKAVFSRDGFTCVVCGKRGGDLHADHIKPFSLYDDLRFDIENGRTLCVPCHKEHGAMVRDGVQVKHATGPLRRAANWIIG